MKNRRASGEKPLRFSSRGRNTKALKEFFLLYLPHSVNGNATSPPRSSGTLSICSNLPGPAPRHKYRLCTSTFVP